jgi:hypothetical protein
MRKGDDSSPFGGDGWPDGRWVRVLGGPAQAYLVSEAFTEIEPRAERWLNKDFFRVEKIKSVEVRHADAANSWTIFRETEGGALKLADPQEGEELDTGKASPVGNLLSWPSFADVVPPDAPAELTGMDAPVLATIETFEGFTYTLKVGKPAETGDNHHLQVSVAGSFPRDREAPEGESAEDKDRLDKEFKERTGRLEEKLTKEKALAGWTYLVSKWTIENLLKERKDFLQSAEPATGGAAGATPPLPPGPWDPYAGAVNPGIVVEPGPAAHDHDPDHEH